MTTPNGVITLTSLTALLPNENLEVQKSFVWCSCLQTSKSIFENLKKAFNALKYTYIH